METKNKMLIDATHPEETRVVVLRSGRVEEFDYESAARKLLRGNIYLAKVTRVEPSLQAAFVDYGGNRHGFLAFSEIHPDYYQIPVADRQALLQEDAEADAEAEAEAEARAQAADRPSEPEPGIPQGPSDGDGSEAMPAKASVEERKGRQRRDAGDTAVAGDAAPDALGSERSRNGGAEGHVEEIVGDAAEAPESVGASLEQVGAEDALEEVPERPRRHIRSYKIQEVIKRRQIILVQVVKEERGSKGAALTTYLSLAGRYTVLMPNTGRGGGISRKITNPQDRKRLKAIAEDLEVPEGMGLIIRTAGAARTKQEIRRDFEYLLRLWENVRDLTLRSTAPSLVYEEGNLIKRSIRDLYSKDIDEIKVAGEAAHKEAQDFMRMLSPSQAKNVIRFDEPESLFARYQIERQLNAMFSPYVTLRSGGYLVINQTEALVAIDVNSGKATREFSIEETALQTNLEAAEEIARQVKLRDLAGLIVIDFIDMEERRNNRRVESRLKDSLRHDRARIQIGRISHFGLLEMSRQRLRTGVTEGSTSQCPHCQGTGIVRSTESVALAVLRAVDDHLARDTRSSLTAVTTADVALYILNNKRAFVTDMEQRYGVSIAVQAGDRMQGANFAIEKAAAPAPPQKTSDRPAAVNMEWGFEGQEGEETSGERAEIEVLDEREGESEVDGRRPRRRRRRGRREDRPEQRGRPEPARLVPNGEADAAQPQPAVEKAPSRSDSHQEAGPDIPGLGEQPPLSADEQEERRGRKRRRGRRGGRRGRDREASPEEETQLAPGGNGATHAATAEVAGGEGAPEATPHAYQPHQERLQPAPHGMEGSTPQAPRPARPEPPVGADGGAAPQEAPAETRRVTAAGPEAPSPAEIAPAGLDVPPRGPARTEPLREEPPTHARKGWWQRR